MMKIAAILTSAAIACAPVACPVQENFAARCAADRIDCVQNVHALPHAECVLRL